MLFIVHDHIVVGKSGYYSFQNEGLVWTPAACPCG